MIDENRNMHINEDSFSMKWLKYWKDATE